MSLSFASTLDEIKAAYIDGASYREDASPAKARVFITACRILLLKLPGKASSASGEAVEIDQTVIERQLHDAEAWLAAVEPVRSPNPSAGVSFPDFGGFRG